MKKFLVLTLFLLAILLAGGMFVNARHEVTTIWNTTIYIHSDIPDTEKYILDEEANKDKLYCKTKSDAEGKVIQTDWYNYCNSEFVKSEKADTCTKELRYPEYECEFAKGSNADKLYCRSVKDSEGKVVETKWFNYCSENLIKTEEGDACTAEFKNPIYKCYKYEAEEEPVEEEEVVEEEVPEEEPAEIPPEEAPEITLEPEITPTKAKPYTWIALIAVLVIIAVAAVMFLKKGKKPEKEK